MNVLLNFKANSEMLTSYEETFSVQQFGFRNNHRRTDSMCMEKNFDNTIIYKKKIYENSLLQFV